MKRTRHAGLQSRKRGQLLLALAFLFFGRHAVLAEPVNEYQVKAVFLFNFAKFVEWPAQDSASAICVGIVGKDPFGTTLEQVVHGKTVNGREFVVKRLKTGQEARGCQIVFVGSSEKKRFRTILDAFQGHSILTVGEGDEFCRNGGVIQFELENNKVRFAANLDAAERARLKLSSKLLGVAKIVRDGEK